MAYQENSRYVRVNGSGGTGIWSGAPGSTLPVDLTTVPGAPFKTGLGILHDSGITLSVDKEVTDVHGLADGKLARRIRGKVLSSFKFGCLEQTAEILSLRFPGTWSLSGTGATQFAKLSLVDGQTDDVQRALILDLVDRTSSGTYYTRIVGSALDIQADGELTLGSNKDVVASMFTASPVAGSVCDLYTNSPGVIEQLAA